MPLVPMTTLLAEARRGGYAVGYFEAWDSYSLEAVVEAAEAERAPVILGFGCMMVDRTWLDEGGLEVLGCVGRAVAARARVPAALLLNETRTYEQAVRGIDAGFNAVMMDTRAEEDDGALESVSRLVEVAHARGVAVEGEVGSLPDAVGGEIHHAAASLTDPEQAAAFVERTGVDCLAVSIGNVHLLERGFAPVDLDLLAAVRRRVSVPLAIHGGSSFPPDAVRPAVANGVAKFNVGTVLKRAFLDGVRGATARLAADVDVHDVLGSHTEGDLLVAGKARMRATVRELIALYGGSGRA